MGSKKAKKLVIPTKLGNCTSLLWLDLNNNRLSGSQWRLVHPLNLHLEKVKKEMSLLLCGIIDSSGFKLIALAQMWPRLLQIFSNLKRRGDYIDITIFNGVMGDRIFTLKHIWGSTQPRKVQILRYHSLGKLNYSHTEARLCVSLKASGHTHRPACVQLGSKLGKGVV